MLRHLSARKEISVSVHAPLIPVPLEVSENLAHYRALGCQYFWTRDLKWASAGAAVARMEIRKATVDHVLVFNPADAAFLDCDAPISILLDATWSQFIDTYAPYQELPICEETQMHGAMGERLAFERVSFILCMTPWAVEGVLREYPECADKIRLILPGANLVMTPNRESVEERIRLRAHTSHMSALFIGAATYRKGVDIAIESCKQLAALGTDITLDVVGSDSIGSFSLPSFMTNHGFLDKGNPAHLIQLEKLMLKSSIFILPTRAECAGLVLAEASAYGIPSVISGSGGTSALIIDNRNGIVVGTNASPSEYASAISNLMSDTTRYIEMSLAARSIFEKSLNWGAFVTEMLKVISSKS